MIKIEKPEFSNACTEVLEILKYIKEEDLEKIPNFEIEILQKNENKNHQFIYNPNITMKEQKVSKLAKAIIATYFEKYIATEKQKKKIREQRMYDNSLIEKRKSEEHKRDNLFNNNSHNIVSSNKTNELVKINNKKWYKILWEKIKRVVMKLK